MKRFLCLLLAIMLLCGCSTKPADAEKDNSVVDLTEKIENTCAADRDHARLPYIYENSFPDMDIPHIR